MKTLFLVSSALTACLVFSSCTRQPAQEIRLPKIFGDNMVLQQGEKVAVWGNALPGGEVGVKIGSNSTETIVDDKGKWSIELPAMNAGGPYDLKIIGKDTITYANVMVGEVWICSGQSNMEWPLRLVNYAEKEIKNADYNKIRLFKVNKSMSVTPLDTINAGRWNVCSPEYITNFSAVAYFFGRELYKNLDVPVGLIQTSWGGTPAEAWTTPLYSRKLPDFKKQVEYLHSDSAIHSFLEIKREMEMWEETRDKQLKASLSEKQSWFSEQLKDHSWEKMHLPVKWEKSGHPNLDGIVVFRKSFELPESFVDKNAVISLGPIDDEDITYINGEFIGSTRNFNKQRKYELSENILKNGKNLVSIKVTDSGGGGGIWGNKKQMWIQVGDTIIDLSGEWKYKVGVDVKDLPPKPKATINKKVPTVLYNAMVNPLIPFTAKGVIWYQGEANANRAYQYRSVFPTMIRSWRNAWDEKDMPFLFVQLANFKKRKANPSESEWAELREAQYMTLSLPNTGMAVTIDIGDADDIHPRNKKDVGKRLALNARALVYKEDIVYSGPRFKSMNMKDDTTTIITFDHAGSGLVTKSGEAPKGFAIAGADSNFVWAQARIEGNTVVLTSKEVKNPIAVRYAWADNPECNLYNEEGLPAVPFRTDDWPGLTINNK